MMNQSEIDPYEILEIEPGAPRPEIERAYYLARLAYSSDSLASYSLYSPGEKSAILERIERAYRILTDRREVSPDDVPGSQTPPADVLPIERPSEEPPLPDGSPEGPIARETLPAGASLAEPRASLLPQGRGPLLPIPGRPGVEASDVPRPYDAEALRKIRESRGLGLQEISVRTKISRKNLRNIESGDYGALPPTVYLKGYLAQYAQCLRLKPAEVIQDFLEAVAKGKDPDGKHE
jgi:hypothetical protein